MTTLFQKREGETLRGQGGAASGGPSEISVTRQITMKTKRSTALLLTLSFLSIAGLSSADDVESTEKTSFDIPSQNLETALIRFSEQTDLQLVMASEEVSGKAVEGISGEWSNFAALDELLEGTGLGYQLVSDHTVAIGAADSGRGDSDSKNLSAEPVLMAQNMPNQTSSYEPAKEDKGGSENEGPEAKNGGKRATRGQPVERELPHKAGWIF